MICHEHKFIHVHIHRTGGTSIERRFGHKSYDHRGINKYIEEYGKEVWDNYFTFAFTRNPWDRILGTYQWNRQIARAPLRERYGFDSMSFRDFVFRYKKLYKNNPQANSHCKWLVENNKPIVDYIGRFENYQSDYDIICDRIGIPRHRLPHVNKTDHKHYTEYYDDETKQVVADLYPDDIEYFEYSFEI
jgi:chondroitin 4-sulfotransferase 11